MFDSVLGFLICLIPLVGSVLPQYRPLCVCLCVCVKKVSKKFDATSKQGRRLKLGMLTVLTNIRSTKVL